MENASSLICPVLVMQAGEDKIVDKKKTEEFFNKFSIESFYIKYFFGNKLFNTRLYRFVFRDILFILGYIKESSSFQQCC